MFTHRHTLTLFADYLREAEVEIQASLGLPPPG